MYQSTLYIPHKHNSHIKHNQLFFPIAFIYQPIYHVAISTELSFHTGIKSPFGGYAFIYELIDLITCLPVKNMNTILTKYKIDCIWHFTDKSNLESIQKHKGLLSLGELERRRIEIPVPGGNQLSHDLDKAEGLHKYVHMAFVSDPPMLFDAKKEGRITDPIFLKVRSTILLEKGVLFCSKVSNSSDAVILDANQAKAQIDFDVLFTPMDWKDTEVRKRRRAARKSEILVPNFVPIEMILML